MSPRPGPLRGGRAVLAPALLAVVALAGACNSDGSADSTTTTAEPAAPEVVIAAAIDRVGPWRARLGSVEANRRLLTLVFATRGTTRAEAACYADIAVPAFGEEEFGDLTIHALQSWASVTVLDVPLGPRREAAVCVSAESAARTKADELSPDLDIAESRAVVREMIVLQSAAMGLTDTEAECYAAASIDDLSDEQLRGGLANTIERSVRDPEGGIRDCLDEERREELAPTLAAAIAAQEQIEAAEHDTAQAKINQEIRDGMSSTTVP